MQDARVGKWAQESHLSPDMLRSLRELNHRFLDLAAARNEWAAIDVAPLSAAQRAAAAACPYALFDLRFADAVHWQACLQNCASWQVADEFRADDATIGFVRLALFFAWHVASNAGIAAQLLLGMNLNTAAAFRRITVNRLPALVVSEAPNLSARFGGCAPYWRGLVAAAARTDPRALRRVQLYGLQLAAASRLAEP
jgi:hypothetical protein